MTPKKIGLITYNAPHLKTEQVFLRLIKQDLDLRMYALPFTSRKPREVLFTHRPNQGEGENPEALAKKYHVPFIKCARDTEIDNFCDIYLILGAGILSEDCVRGKKIINCHPGIIPASRGLDAFKWSVYDMKPLGITLHYIDADVDSGEIISILPTNIYHTDSLATLARRHYDSEIDMFANFSKFLENPINPYKNIASSDPRRRMPLAVEREMYEKFSQYVEKYGTSL